MLPYFDDFTVRAALQWEELIPAMERALAELSSGRVMQPAREWITLEEGNRYWGIMPAAGATQMGVKLVSFYPGNEGSDLPTIMALVLLVDPDSGQPLAVMDARSLTALRTAAVSAAVTRRLAAPNARVLAILGSGEQAASHLAALAHVCAFDEVRVWSRTPEHAQRFAVQHGAHAMGAEAAVRGADVIVTATGAREPILRGAWLKPGSHVNAIGAPMPTWRELDDEAMDHVVVVESRESVARESGDVILSGARIHSEVGEIFAGSVEAPTGVTTVFKSVGVAIEDVAAARLALESLQRNRPVPP